MILLEVGTHKFPTTNKNYGTRNVVPVIIKTFLYHINSVIN